MKQDIIKKTHLSTDVIVIIDTSGKVMYYEDFDDNLNVLKGEEAIGHSIFDLYPYFKRSDFTVFKAIEQEKPILNEYQQKIINGKKEKFINSAYPLINENGIIGGIVISTELTNLSSNRKALRSNAKYCFDDIITNDSAFIAEIDKMKKIAQNDSAVLIYGETGTGKELLAHAIHNAGKRANKPFIVQNCAAIPASIMEGLLFGTGQGSFTGSIDKEGLFEAADKGTIYLDEINSMPLEMQSKILRSIESKTVRRVGETFERPIDVRIISSTNENLQKKIQEGSFRADLYYRLNVVRFTIPPLRERQSDIVLLADYYRSKYNRTFNKNVSGLSEDVRDIFTHHSWHGNIRELRNVLEYAINLSDEGLITEDSLPDYLHTIPDQSEFTSASSKDKNKTNPNLPLPLFIEQCERERIVEVLSGTGGSITLAAKRLGIPRQTLYYKLNKYNLQR